MTQKEIEQKQNESNRMYDVAKQIAALLASLDDEQREQVLEMINE